MPRVSRNKLDEKKLQEITDYFSSLISFLSNPQTSENFFSQFLTQEEKLMLAKRLVLFMFLKKGYSPIEIQTALSVSYETVRTYHIQLQFKNTLFHKTLDELVKREQTTQFFEKINKILKPIELALKAKSNMKARAKLAHGGEI